MQTNTVPIAVTTPTILHARIAAICLSFFNLIKKIINVFHLFYIFIFLLYTAFSSPLY